MTFDEISGILIFAKHEQFKLERSKIEEKWLCAWKKTQNDVVPTSPVNMEAAYEAVTGVIAIY